MMPQFWLIVAVCAAIIFTAGAAFLWSMVQDRHAGEKIPFDHPDFSQHAGFAVVHLPEKDFLSMGDIYLLGRSIGHIEFVIDPGWTAVLRVAAHEGNLRLSDFGTTDYDQLTVRQVDGIRTELRQEQSGEALACWQRDGFSYALYLPDAEMGLAGSMMECFVRECRSELR